MRIFVNRFDRQPDQSFVNGENRFGAFIEVVVPRLPRFDPTKCVESCMVTFYDNAQPWTAKNEVWTFCRART